MKYLYSVLNYVLAVVLVLTIHQVSPTNMAGPGCDLVVYLIAPLLGIMLLARSILRVRKGNRASYILIAINTIGVLIVTLAVYYVFGKKN
jgi:hypothetical protein